MKLFLAAAAAAPLLFASGSSAAQSDAPSAERRVIFLGDDRTVVDEAEIEAVVAQALEAAEAAGAFEIDAQFDELAQTASSEAALDRAMETLAEAMARLEAERAALRNEDMTDAEREAMAARRDRLRENLDDIEVRVELAVAESERVREHAERARIHGLRAGARGMRTGLRGIDRALERGWVEENGERRELTADEIAELREARAELAAELEAFRAEHAEILADAGDGTLRRVNVVRFDGDAAAAPRDRRRVRIEETDGRRRVWMNGEELTGDALTDWLNSREADRLAGPPPAPEAPDRP